MNQIGIRALLAGLVFFSLSLGSRSVSAQTAEQNTAFGLFSQPSCEVHPKREKLAIEVKGEFRPEGDGSIPWLDLFGTWVDETRGIYIQFSTDLFSHDRFGVARVVVKSLCDNSVLAQGARLVTEDDLDAEMFEVSLRVYGRLRYNQLSIGLQMSKGLSVCATRVRFTRLDTMKPKVVDEFWVYRP